MAADLDGDGDLDLMVAGAASNGLIWFENLDGIGTSWVPDTLESNMVLGNFVVADMNGDGSNDVVYHDEQDQVLKWRVNDGTGTFGPAEVIGALAAVGGTLICSDIAGSPLPEVIHSGPARTVWYVNNAGAFTVKDSLATVGGPSSPVVLVGDMDLDSDPDFVTINWSGFVEVGNNLAGDGTQWQSDLIPGVSFMWLNSQTMQLLDVDGDGDLDVVDATHESKWLENLTADGAAWPSFQVHALAEWPEWGSGWCTDLGCGPGVDMLWTPTGDSLNVLMSSYDSSMNAFTPPTAISGLNRWDWMRTADLNGDGSEDLIVGRSDSLVWYANQLPMNAAIASVPPLDTLCMFGGQYVLPDGAPSGGAWDGPAVAGNVFDASMMPPGAYPLTYTALDSNGCPTSVQEPISVIFGPTITPQLSGTLFCIDEDIQFSATPSGGTWPSFLGANGNLSANCALRPLGGEVSNEYTDVTGATCVGMGVFVELLPCAVPSLSSGGQHCITDTVITITASGPALGGVNLYGAFDSLEFSTMTTSVIGYFDPSQGAGTYPVYAVASGAGQCQDTAYTTVVVDPVPTVPIIAGAPTICAGQLTTLVVSNPQPGVEYEWNDGTPGGSLDVATGGTYNVTASNSCGQQISSNFMVVELIPGTPCDDQNACTDGDLILADCSCTGTQFGPIGPIVGPDTVFADSTYVFSINAIPYAVDYEWNLPSTHWTTADSLSSVLVATAGAPIGEDTLCVAILNAGGCLLDTCLAIVVDNTVAIVSPGEADGDFKVFPNPSNDVFRVVLKSSSKTEGSIFLTDAVGRTVWGPRQAAPGSTVEVDLSDHGGGLYILYLNQGGRVRSERLLLQGH